MADLSTNILIIIFNINGLNTHTKRQKLAEWIKLKHAPTIHSLKETHFKQKTLSTLLFKAKRQEKKIHHEDTDFLKKQNRNNF